MLHLGITQVMTVTKSYSELCKLKTLEERYKYLRGTHAVGDRTMGGYRPLYLKFLKSDEWLRFRREIILRDNGNDMALDGYPIPSRVIIHHINPVTIRDLMDHNIEILLNPENVVCVSHQTHLAIDYGDESLLPKDPIERKPNDTCPWR